MRLEFVVTGQAQLNWSDAHGSTPMKKEVFAILEPGNSLMTQAIDALKRYHEAQAAGLPGAEVERCGWKLRECSRRSRSFSFEC